MANDSVKSKIAKLLEMTTERGCSEAEAAVALEKAQKLLSEHNLTEVEVLGHKENKDHRENGDILAFAWAKRVARAVAELYDCQYFERTSERKNHFAGVFKGRQSNAETAKLITEFVVKTILKLSREAQKEAGAGNRYATDFQHGCADRIRRVALGLWREANKDLIEEKMRQRKAEQDRREAFRIKPEALEPGKYLVELVGKDYAVRKELVLDEKLAAKCWKETMENPPRGIYLIYMKCLEGLLKSEYEFSWMCRELPADNRKGRVHVQDYRAYMAGDEAGKNVGLRVQVNADPAKQVK